MAQFVAGAGGSACPINSADAVVKCRNELANLVAVGPLDVYRRNGRERWFSALVQVIGEAESVAA